MSYAMLEDRGLILAAAGTGSALACILIWKHSDLALLPAVATLIGAPFFLGFNRTPKIFADETLLLLLLGIVSLKALFQSGTLTPKLRDFFWPLVALSLICMTLLHNRPDNIGLRTLAETFGLGVPLCLLCLRLSSEITATRVSLIIALMVILIAAYGLIEVVSLKNPIMDYVVRTYGDEYTYLSPDIAAATGGTYRPYVVFFHPSEGGTVVALCLPFLAALWNDRRCRAFAGIALPAGLGFIVVNATRGVWLAVAATTLMFLPRLRKGIMPGIPVLAAGAWLVPSILGRTAFWERIADFRNLRIRFWYWDLAISHLTDNWLFGMGYGQFSEQYLIGSPPIPPDIYADVQQVATVDNSYLMILVEQGILGLGGLLLLIGFLLARLRQAHAALIAKGRLVAAGYARAALASLCIYLLCALFADVHLFTKSTKLVFMLIGLGWGVFPNEPEGRPAP